MYFMTSPLGLTLCPWSVNIDFWSLHIWVPNLWNLPKLQVCLSNIFLELSFAMLLNNRLKASNSIELSYLACFWGVQIRFDLFHGLHVCQDLLSFVEQSIFSVLYSVMLTYIKPSIVLSFPTEYSLSSFTKERVVSFLQELLSFD